MANHKSAQKSIRQDEKRNLINKSRKSRIKTFLKRVDLAISSHDLNAANSALSNAHSQIMKGVSKKVMKLNTASRIISRLSAKIKKNVIDNQSNNK